jgi:hypothetical protein
VCRKDEPNESSHARYFFIHVMKTGGMALSTNLSQNFAVDEVYPHPELDLNDFSSNNVRFRAVTISYLRSLPEERQRTIRLYAGHFPFVVCELLGGGFHTMTLLRDPVDRTVSLLRQLQRFDASNATGESASSVADLEEIYERADVYEPLVHNHQTKIFSMTVDDDPRGYMQSIDVDEARLGSARRNLESVDVLGLTERHADFVDDLVAKFGWRLKRDVRVNAAPDDSPEISDTFRRRIEADNAIDIEFYGYATQLVAARRN